MSVPVLLFRTRYVQARDDDDNDRRRKPAEPLWSFAPKTLPLYHEVDKVTSSTRGPKALCVEALYYTPQRVDPPPRKLLKETSSIKLPPVKVSSQNLS